MNTLPLSRRGILVGGAAFSAAAPLGAASSLAGPHPDAELFALTAKHEAIGREYLSAADAAAAIDPERPEMPAALLWRENDHDLKLIWEATTRSDGQVWFWVRGRAETELRGQQMRVRNVPVGPGDKAHSGATHVTKKVAWPERQARTNEIVAAWDRWQEEIAEVERASGYTAAAERVAQAGGRMVALEEEIRGMAPRTLAGLAALARFVQRLHVEADDEELEGGVLARAILAVAGMKDEDLLPCA
ncbi:hypothetical protein MKK50_18010 [Methylobacterium sp. J-043]|nr:hypothetical protein [Methylobacterium sp. J-043]